MTTEVPDFQLTSSLRFDPLLLQCSPPGADPGPFYMLQFHCDRLVQAAKHFNWQAAISRLTGPDGMRHLQQKLEAAIDLKVKTPSRIRISLQYNGNVTVETSETPTVPLSNLFPTRIPPPRAPEMNVCQSPGSVLNSGVDSSLEDPPGNGEPYRTQAWTVMVDPERTRPSPFTTYKTTCRDMYNGARKRVGIKTITEPKEVLIISINHDEIMEGSISSVLFWRNRRWVTPPIACGGQAGTTRRWLLEEGLCVEEAVSFKSLSDGEECWISNGVRGLIWGRVKL